MKVAAIQLKVSNNKTKNLQKAIDFVEKAAKNRAEFILLPELFIYQSFLQKKEDLKGITEKTSGCIIKAFKNIAKKKKVFILAGSIYEERQKKKEKERTGKDIFNTSVLINDKGQIIASYRKINLFEALINGKKIKESKIFSKGELLALAGVKTFKVGLSICYDLRFPYIYSSYRQQKADIFCVPSAFTKETGREHWEVLLRARAIENACYVIAPNQVGENGGGILTYGNSMIIDPWGKALARASANKEEIIYAKLKLQNIRENRNKILKNFYGLGNYKGRKKHIDIY